MKRRLCRTHRSGASLNGCGSELGALNAYPTADGSFSLHSEHFGEAFHNAAGALNEARAKFVKPAQLGRFQKQQCITVLDVCLGLGYNSAAVMDALPVPGPNVNWWGLELDRRPLRQALAQDSFRQQWSQPVLKRLDAIDEQGGWCDAHGSGQVLWGDARHKLNAIPKQIKFDLILQDPFSPQRCPELWSEEFLTNLASRLTPEGRLLTYSRSAAVRASLKRAGLALHSLLPAPGERVGWSSGTMATPQASGCPDHGPGWRPLSSMEQEHLRTRAAVPFRDPDQTDTCPSILERRRQEQTTCSLEATNGWQRRWKQTTMNQPIQQTDINH